MVNHHGEVVGVSTFSVTVEEGAGLNFATAASEVSIRSEVYSNEVLPALKARA